MTVRLRILSLIIIFLLISLNWLACDGFSVFRAVITKSTYDRRTSTVPPLPRPSSFSLYETKEDTASDKEEGSVFKITRDDDDYRDFTFGNVDDVLNEIRPYLIQDGGNVTISSIDTDTRSVYVHLVGACGSCPSSTTTMKMGIERVLKENFKDLGSVESVLPASIDMGVLGETLQNIMPVITDMDGTASIYSVDQDTGEVVILYEGPDNLKKGLELIFADTNGVKEVKLMSKEELIAIVNQEDDEDGDDE